VPEALLAELRTSRDAIAEQLAVDGAFREQQRFFLARAREFERLGFDRDSAERCALAEVIAQSAPPLRPWQEELRIVEEDLAAEGTSLAQVEREMRAGLPVKPQRKPPTIEEQRWRRWRIAYREVYPLPGVPAAPCSTCDERLYYRTSRGAPWRCHRCERPNAQVRVDRWWIVPPAPTDLSPVTTPPPRPGSAMPDPRCSTTSSRR
jgi:hypothetical protein